MKRLFKILFLIGFISVVALPGSECHTGVCYKHFVSKNLSTKLLLNNKSSNSHCHNKASQSGKSNHNQNTEKSSGVEKNSNECNSMGNCYLLGELNKEPEISINGANSALMIDLYVVFVLSSYEILPNNQATNADKIEIWTGLSGESVSLFKRKSSYLI